MFIRIVIVKHVTFGGLCSQQKQRWWAHFVSNETGWVMNTFC